MFDILMPQLEGVERIMRCLFVHLTSYWLIDISLTKYGYSMNISHKMSILINT
jgi:hypothetical protein